MQNSSEQNRSLSFIAALALVIGTMIGTGVFLKAAIMSQTVGSSYWVLIAWVVAGLLSLAGALTYAEIGALFPRAGGEYVYLKEGYGELVAFLYGWQRFLISSPGTIAAYAVGTATFAASFLSLEMIGGRTALAIYVILFFSALNCLNVQFGGRLQSVMTLLKVLMIVFIIGGALFFSPTAGLHNMGSWTDANFPGWSAFGAAMLAALWAYDGWNNMPMVAGEIKDPQKNIPRSLILGVLFLVGLYTLIHFCYFYALPFAEVATSSSSTLPDALPVAAKTAAAFMGQNGIMFLGIAMMFSAVGAMNGSILTSARVPYAMSKDKLFFSSLGNLHKKTNSPYISIIIQAVLSVIMALSGSFDQLTDYVVFASWIFYALVAYSLFIFRKKLPNVNRPYKTLGYPVVPIVFIVLASLLLLNTLWTNTQSSLYGVLIIVLGIPFFYLMKKKIIKI